MSRFGTGALGRVVRSGVGRRRVQTVVIAVAAMMAVASAVVAGSLMVAADAPFDKAFARQNGPHITAEYDPAKATTAELEATGRLDGVTATAGPYPAATLRPVDAGGGHLRPITLAGRSTPHADVDDLELSSGRWATKPGEIVLTPQVAGPALELGTELKTSDAVRRPDPDGRRHRRFGRPVRRRLGNSRAGQGTCLAGHPGHQPDALPLRLRGHRRPDRRRPQAARRRRTVGGAARHPVLSGHQARRRRGRGADHPLPDRLRRARHRDVGDHRRQCGQRRGRHRPAQDRHPQGHRLHPARGRPRLCRPGVDPGRRRHRRSASCWATCWPYRCWTAPSRRTAPPRCRWHGGWTSSCRSPRCSSWGSRHWSPHCGPDGCVPSRPSPSAGRRAPGADSGRTGRRADCRCRAR